MLSLHFHLKPRHRFYLSQQNQRDFLSIFIFNKLASRSSVSHSVSLHMTCGICYPLTLKAAEKVFECLKFSFFCPNLRVLVNRGCKTLHVHISSVSKSYKVATFLFRCNGNASPRTGCTVQEGVPPPYFSSSCSATAKLIQSQFSLLQVLKKTLCSPLFVLQSEADQQLRQFLRPRFSYSS